MPSAKNPKKTRKLVKQPTKSHGPAAKSNASPKKPSSTRSTAPTTPKPKVLSSVPKSVDTKIITPSTDGNTVKKPSLRVNLKKNPRFASAEVLKEKPAPIIFSQSTPRKRKANQSIALPSKEPKSAKPNNKKATEAVVQMAGLKHTDNRDSESVDDQDNAMSVSTASNTSDSSLKPTSKEDPIDVEQSIKSLAKLGFVPRKKKRPFYGVYIVAVIIREPDGGSTTLFRLRDPQKKESESTYMEWKLVNIDKNHSEFARRNGLGEPYHLWFHKDQPMANKSNYIVRLFPLSSSATPTCMGVFKMAERIAEVLTSDGKLTKPMPMEDGFFWIKPEDKPVWSDVVGTKKALELLQQEIGEPPVETEALAAYYERNSAWIWCHFRPEEMQADTKKLLGVPTLVDSFCAGRVNNSVSKGDEDELNSIDQMIACQSDAEEAEIEAESEERAIAETEGEAISQEEEVETEAY